MESIFIILISAHCYVDFLLQTEKMFQNKGRLPVILLHAAIHGLLAYVFLQSWFVWQVPLLLAGLHFLIDWIKVKRIPSPAGFAMAQVAHVLSLAAVACWVVEAGHLPRFSGWGWSWIVTGAGFCAVVFGSGYYVGAVAECLIKENEVLREDLKTGLRNGGKKIGQLERALIFVLMLINQPAGIGFLVAAKSILRFEESKKQPVAEYVLIGTLWSYSLAIALSWITTYALMLAP
jgi:hypothetical protein